MSERILVTGKKISSMELVTNVTGIEKIPTGQQDDLAINPNQIADYTIARGSLVNRDDLSQVEGDFGIQVEDLVRDIEAEEAARIAADSLKVDKEGSVSSVAGRVGDVVLAPSDVLVEGFGSQEDVNKYVPKAFLSGYTYGLGERVVLDDGEVVKSLIDGNASNPNADMTGWVSAVSASLSDTIQTFTTPEAGVDPVTGVADGAYFNVRSSSGESYIDEYQNVGGNAVATGRKYLSALGIQLQEKSASTIKDASGKNQQNINDLSLLNNPVGLFDINGSGDETVKFQALLDTLPKHITLDPNKTYNTTGKLYVKSDCVIDGQGATINCTAPISTPEMEGSMITQLTKGDFTITVSDGSKFSIFEEVLIYYNEDNSDTWYTDNQLSFDVLGITSQKNQILGISGNVLTLKFANESKLSDIPTRTSTVYKIPQNQVIIKNVTFNITANSWIWLRCSGIRHQNCKFKKAGGSISGFSNQMCYKPTFFDCEVGEGLSIGFNYGTYNWHAERNTFYAGRSSDGLLVTYAGTNFGTSRSNRFLVRNMPASDQNAGLYWGAKSRNCHSYDDVVVGLDYGFRVMFGAQQCSINNMTTKNIGTFTGFVSYSSVEINNITGFDKPIRTMNAENLTIRGGFLFNTDPETTPLLLDLNRNLTSSIRNNYYIDGLHCDGMARIWVAVNNFNILNSYFKVLDHYASAVSTRWDVRGNLAGAMRFSMARDFKISDNTIDESLAPGLISHGLEFRSNCHVSCFDGNTIKHSSIGIDRELETSHIYLAHGNNNIIAPTAMNIYLPSPPNNGELNALCGDGFKMLHSDFFTKGRVWTRRNGSWVINTVDMTYDPPSLAAAGTAGASVTTTVPFSGAAVGDAVCASFSQYNADIEISAAVSASSTVRVKFKNTGEAPVDLASGTLTVKLV